MLCVLRSRFVVETHHRVADNRLFDFAPGQEPAMADWIADIVGEDA